jgi:hypothetical protein
VTKFEDGIPLEWGKPLHKVFWRYPKFSHANTVMIDHKICRVGGNPVANLIIPIAFYVVELEKIGDDKGFLIRSLWPQLQAPYRCKDIDHFHEHFPESEVDNIVKMLAVSRTCAASNNSDSVEGEGTSGPIGST